MNFFIGLVLFLLRTWATADKFIVAVRLIVRLCLFIYYSALYIDDVVTYLDQTLDDLRLRVNLTF